MEGAAIVTSILLAFALQASWEIRVERGRAADLLGRLESEFTENLLDLDKTIDGNRQFAEASLVLGTIDLESFRTLPSDSLLTLITGIGGENFFVPSQPELLGAVQSGEIAVIRNLDLRAALAAWTEANQALERQRQRLELRNEQRAQLFRISGFYSAVTADQTFDEVVDARRASLLRILADGSFREHALEHRLFRLRYVELLAEAKALVEAVLELVAQEAA